MTKKNIFLDKRCPFFWDDDIGNNSCLGKIMDEKTLKCIVPQVKDYEGGEPGCCFHGSRPPKCKCLGRKSIMKKIGPNLWECPLCQGKITGSKDKAGYLDFDYEEYHLRKKKTERISMKVKKFPKCSNCGSDCSFGIKHCIDCWSQISKIINLGWFSDVELLTELGKRIQKKEIQHLYSSGHQVLQVPKLPGEKIDDFDQVSFTLFLDTGEVKSS